MDRPAHRGRSLRNTLVSAKIVLVTDYTWPSTQPEAAVLAAVDARLLRAETGCESVRELPVKAAENVAAILAGRRPATVVNPEVLTLPHGKHLR